uniref:Uncharacterized protein n=1 Tax=Solanum lycopersicum TaxID=4081 RepID=A0A3Q7EBX6_SOLLC
MPSNLLRLTAGHLTCSNCRCPSQLAYTGATPCHRQAARSIGSHLYIGGRAVSIATGGMSTTILRSGSCNCNSR